MTTVPHFKILKISYKEADISVREKFSLSKEERSAFYQKIRHSFEISEALIISTCNRTEIIYISKTDLTAPLLKLLCDQKQQPYEKVKQYFTAITCEEEAVQHLFEVAVGLDSLVLGDIQIHGQFKQTYYESVAEGMVNTYMQRVAEKIFRTHKDICAQTALKKGAASCSYNTVKLIEQHASDRSTPILIVGLGEMGEDVCKHLLKFGYSNVTITNRTQSKIEHLLSDHQLTSIPYTALASSLQDFSVLVSCVGVKKPILSATELESTVKMTVLDLGSPRSVSSHFVQQYAKHYFDIDHIGSLTTQTLNEREAAVAEAKALIDRAIDELYSWFEDHSKTQKIKSFKGKLEAIRQETMCQYSSVACPDTHKLIDEISSAIVQKIVKIPVVKIRNSQVPGEALVWQESLNQLFCEPIINNDKPFKA